MSRTKFLLGAQMLVISNFSECTPPSIVRMDTGEPCTYVRTVVGANVAALCAGGRLNQRVLSQMTGMNRSYLNELICGKVNPSLDKLVKLADAFEVPITELFLGIDHDAPSELTIDYDSIRRPTER